MRECSENVVKGKANKGNKAEDTEKMKYYNYKKGEKEE